VFNVASHVPDRVVRAGLVVFAVATTAFAPSAAWARGPDALTPSAPLVDVIAPKPAADLTVTQIASADPVRVGNFLTYRLKVTNNGPSTSVNARLGDQIPVTSVLVSASAGCAVGNSPTFVTCQLGNLASGASTWRSITVRPLQVGPITNWVRVSSPVTFDPVPANDVSVLTTTVTP
jgi:uncharacterized repeat protein (TIGR01451 family)